MEMAKTINVCQAIEAIAQQLNPVSALMLSEKAEEALPP